MIFTQNGWKQIMVTIHGNKWLETNHPTGNVFVPLVFLYINEFRENVQGNFDIIQFADETSFHFSRNNVAELEKCDSEILEKTDHYLKQNKITMNTGTTELNFFASRKKMKILIQ